MLELNKNMDCLIRNEKEEDYKIVENLVRESFWNVYKPGCDEHYLVHTIRNDPSFDKSLHFVMEIDNQIIGEALLFPSFVKLDDNKSLPSLTLGPICISKDYQRKGYGKKLLDYCLEKAKEAGHGVIFLEGNISFYGKSGFEVASDFNIRYNNLPIEADTPFFLCKELVKGF